MAVKKKPKGEVASAHAMNVKEFRKQLQHVELIGMTLNDSACAVLGRAAIIEKKHEIFPTVAFEASFSNFEGPDNTHVVVLHHSVVQLLHGEEVLMAIECTFQLEYRSAFPFTDEFFQAFADAALLLQVVPYVREFVQAMTLRMGIPPLTLPMVKLKD